jgi:hypothetical protein
VLALSGQTMASVSDSTLVLNSSIPTCEHYIAIGIQVKDASSLLLRHGKKRVPFTQSFIIHEIA